MAKIRSRGQKKQRLDRSRDSFGSGLEPHPLRQNEFNDLAQLEQIRSRLDQMSAQLDHVDEPS